MEAAYTPVGRGFNASLARLEGGGNQWTHACNAAKLPCGSPDAPIGGGVDHFDNKGRANWDLWEASSDSSFPGAPRTDLVGRRRDEAVYSGHLFTAYAVEKILAHEAGVPLFLFLALMESHSPIDPPAKYMEHAGVGLDWDQERRYHGALAVLDAAAANVTGALRAKGMWEATLLLWLSDNGAGPPRKSTAGGSNHPLRGAKHSLWEGGMRVPALLAGGFLPVAARGRSLHGLVDIADVFATFSHVAGLGPHAPPGGISSSDSISMWPYIAGEVAVSPRSEVLHWFAHVLGNGDAWLGEQDGWQCARTSQTEALYKYGAIRRGRYKLILGQNPWASWYGNFSPNASTVNMTKVEWESCRAECGTVGCLYDIESDPTEHIDLVQSEPGIAADLRARLLAIDPSDPANGQLYHESQQPVPGNAEAFCEAVRRNEGFVVPWR